MSQSSSILILGGNSRFGQAFQRIYSKESISLSKIECDITNERSIQKAFQKYKCKYVLNCAAITDIEYCQKNPKECFEVNTVGVMLLNKLCKKFKRKLIHISSDYAINATNIYGLSKYLSEKGVELETLIIRSNFYDQNTYIVNRLLNHKSVDSFSNMFFNPVSVNRLANEIFKNKEKKGTLNIFGEKKLSYYQFAQKFCNVFAIPTTYVNKAIYIQNPLSVPRPLSSVVKTDIKVDTKLDLEGFKNFLKNYDY